MCCHALVTFNVFMTSFFAVRQHTTSLKYAPTKRNNSVYVLCSNSSRHEVLEVSALYFIHTYIHVTLSTAANVAIIVKQQ